MKQKEENYCVTKCNKKCCDLYRLPITPIDAIRILENLNISPLDFLDLYDVVDREELEDYSLFFNLSNAKGRKHWNTTDFIAIIKYRARIFGMKRVEDGSDSPYKPCVFYNLKDGLCKIHSFKPTVCRLYPFFLREDKTIDYLPKIECPEKWKPKSNNELIKVFEQMDRELEHYASQLKEWNGRYYVNNFDLFLKFMGVLK